MVWITPLTEVFGSGRAESHTGWSPQRCTSLAPFLPILPSFPSSDPKGWSHFLPLWHKLWMDAGICRTAECLNLQDVNIWNLREVMHLHSKNQPQQKAGQLPSTREKRCIAAAQQHELVQLPPNVACMSHVCVHMERALNTPVLNIVVQVILRMYCADERASLSTVCH